MTGEFFLDWAIQAVSLFNVILLLWLGLTVMLNADRRSWGIGLAAGGLLMGSLFFISHSAIIGHQTRVITSGQEFWWHVGLVPVMALPYAWYIVILWYTGFLESRQAHASAGSSLYYRQRYWLLLTTCLGFALVGLLLFANPLSSFSRLVGQSLADSISIAGIPLLILVYAVFIILSIGLSVDALRHPGPTGRLMGNMARNRALRWLMRTSWLLFLVSLSVGWVMVWVVHHVEAKTITARLIYTLGWFDLGIGFLIGLSVFMVGQAITSYEVFTGKSLPRRGLFQYWKRAVILAAGYGVIVSWGLVTQLRAIYIILLGTLLMTVFYALLAWRSYGDRNRFMENLRPFVGSQQLYRNILNGPGEKPNPKHTNEAACEAPWSASFVADIAVSFKALCAEVLETRLACLIPLGPMAILTGEPLLYPQGFRYNIPPLLEKLVHQHTIQTTGIALDPGVYEGMIWAIPLWDERGVIGVLLVGEKQTGGLYTQEEMEIARAAGERLIDIMASAEIAHRLVMLQRQRLVHNQVIDQQARRIIHDDILPILQTAMLRLSVMDGDNHEKNIQSEVVGLLGHAHHQLSDLLHAMPAGVAPEVTRLGLVNALRKTIEGDFQGLFDEAFFQLEPGAAQAAQELPPLVADVLFYAAREAIRNASYHGRGGDAERPLSIMVKIYYHAGLYILIEDNGTGMSQEGRSKDTGQQIKGRPDTDHGQGLALHSTLMAVIGGVLTIESLPGQYTRIILGLPDYSLDVFRQQETSLAMQRPVSSA